MLVAVHSDDRCFASSFPMACLVAFPAVKRTYIEAQQSTNGLFMGIPSLWGTLRAYSSKPRDMLPPKWTVRFNLEALQFNLEYSGSSAKF